MSESSKRHSKFLSLIFILKSNNNENIQPCSIRVENSLNFLHREQKRFRVFFFFAIELSTPELINVFYTYLVILLKQSLSI